jgi:hypothetical protein
VNENRKSCALHRPCEPRNRRERLHCLVHHSALDAHQLADRIGCQYSRLIDYASVNGTAEMPLRHFVAITRATGRPFALAAEVGECGFLLVPEPAPVRVQDVDRELLDVFVSAGHMAERHRAHARERAPESLCAVVAAADLAMTEIAEFKAAALTDAETAR